MNDTIAALATPSGFGAIALIRISGPDTAEVLQTCFRGPALTPRTQTCGRIVDAGGATIDHVLVTLFPAPRSYTGEDVAEISGHGGLLVSRLVLQRILEAGARPATGGEFTQRAFLNGKMDLTQAEAVMDVISAQTELALRSAREQLEGRLGRLAEQLRQDLIAVLAHVEAHIDFPEEDIDPAASDAMVASLQEIAARITGLSCGADQGRILRHGIRTVICGSPNVGKSSLLNILLGFDRALVSHQAGTTRDTIEETLNLDGIPLRLIDTAGVRASEDSLEQAGIRRTAEAIAQADLVLEIFDGSLPRDEASPLEAVPPRASHLQVLNKRDQGIDPSWPEGFGIRLSCLEDDAVEILGHAVRAELLRRDPSWGDDSVAINARHLHSLQRASALVEAAIATLREGQSPEFVAIEVRSALHAIGEIIGQTDIEEILGEIFSRFCIGK